MNAELTIRRNASGNQWLNGLSTGNLLALTGYADRRNSEVADLDVGELARQLGGAVLNVSGGRIVAVGQVVYLPVSNGYVVSIELNPSDTYTVRRWYMRAGKLTPHGAQSRVYCDEVAEVTIQAGSFRSYPGSDWQVAT